jgi:hypothetical protein
MLFGRYASNAAEARYPQLLQGRVFAACPSVQGPAGLNVYDLSGRGRHASIAVQTAPNGWVRSTGRYAVLLNASGRDCINAGTQAGYVDYDLTVCTWVRKLASTTGGAYNNIWGVCRWLSGGSAGSNEYILSIGDGVSGSSNVPASAIEIGTTQYTITGTTAITLNQWQHVAMVRRGTTLTQFLDGKPNGTMTVGSGAIQNRTRNLKIGDSDISVDLGTGTNAEFDDVAVYSRALTDGEIRLLATRRGIAYEARRDVFGQVTGARRRRILTGMV